MICFNSDSIIDWHGDNNYCQRTIMEKIRVNTRVKVKDEKQWASQ